jgi:hypothetical protein
MVKIKIKTPDELQSIKDKEANLWITNNNKGLNQKEKS